MKQASQNYILLKIPLLAILLSIHACDKCSSLSKPSTKPNLTPENNTRPTEESNTKPTEDNNTKPTEDNNTKPTEDNKPTQVPIPIGHVTLGQYNQQNHPVAKQLKLVGNGACTCIVGTLLKEFQANEQDLHQNREKIDKVIESGIKFYASSFANDAANSQATFIEDVLQKLNLEQDQTTMVDPYGIDFLQTKELANESAIEKEMDKFKNSKKLAIVRTGPESWGLISHGDGTFDLFDSHGRQELNAGNSAAFIKRLDTVKAAKHIWGYSPLKAFQPDEIKDLDENTRLQGAVYIHWLK